MKAITAAFLAALFSIGIANAAKPSCDAGTLDTSFGNGGSVALTQPYGAVVSVEGIVLDRKDRTVVPVALPTGGDVTISLLRATEKGSPDKDFGIDGRVAVTTRPANLGLATTLAEDASGRILFLVVSNPLFVQLPDPAANATLTVYRFLENGQPDTTFGTAGAAVIGGLNSVFPIVSMASDADSRVLVALGAVNSADNRIQTTLLRLTADGMLDATFGTGGKAQAALGTTGPDRATDVQIQRDGRILVLGRTHTGVFDTISQNKNWDFYAMRFLANGAVDTSYGTNGSTVIDFGPNQANGRKGRLQADGKLVIAGNVFRTGLTDPFFPYAGWVRLNTDGSRDATFGNNGQASIGFGLYGGVLFDMALQEDGKMVGAVLENIDSGSIAGVMRINADGTIDPTYAGTGVATFLPTGYLGSAGSYVRVDSKNRAVLSLGAGGDVNGLDANFLARFEPGKQGWCK